MKPTRYATCNYKRLFPFVVGMDGHSDYRRFESSGYMPLVVEYLHYKDRHGFPVFSLAHYGEQFGDLMRDPEICVAIDFESGSVEPLYFRNDYMGIEQEVYKERESGQLMYSPRLRSEIDDFLRQWLKNLAEQEFDPAVYKTACEI